MTNEERAKLIAELGGEPDETYEQVAEWACEILDALYAEGADERGPNWNSFATPEELASVKTDPFGSHELFEERLIAERGYTAYRGEVVRRRWELRCCAIRLDRYHVYTVTDVVDGILPTEGMEFLSLDTALWFAQVVELEAQLRGY